MGKHIQEENLKTINGESLIEVDGGNLILPIIPEVPLDGKLYGRKDEEWSEVVVDVSDLATKVEVSDGLDLKANKLDVDADLLQLNTEIGKVEQSLSTKIGDAPSDGKQYARQNEEWSEVVSGGGGSGSLERVDLADGTVAYKLDSNDIIPTTSSIDLRAGNQETAIGAYAVCISAELPEEAGYNTAEGSGSTVSGGGGNTASGDISTISGGAGNTAGGEYSTVSGGQSNTATNYSETVVGIYSDNTGTPETSRVEGSPIFRVGIGTAVNNRKDGFIVTNEGNLKLPEAGTGIELKSPNGTAYKLTVSDAGELVIAVADPI